MSDSSKFDGMSSEEADLRAEIADLTDFDYDQKRNEIADRHSVRVKTLDQIRAEEHRPRRKAQGGFHLPEIDPWPDPVDGLDVLDALSSAIRRFVVIEDAPCAVVALWILHAHAHGAFAISPILLITAATKGCGKSTLLDVVALQSPRPLLSAATTAAALFRSAEQVPTVLCDEGDTYLSEDRRLVTFFNAGHRRGVPFRLCEGENNEPTEYPSWCPKAIAQIGLPHEPTIVDRSIQIELRRKRAGERCEDFSSLEFYPDLHDLARKCARWAADHLEVLRGARPELPPGFTNRRADNWRPLLAIAEVAGGQWPKRAHTAAEAIGQVEDEGLEILLLEDFFELFETQDSIYTQEAVAYLRGIPERPWASLRRGKGIDGAWVARILRPFGIRPERISNGDARKRGYHRAQFVDAWARYLPDRVGKGGEDASSDPSVPSTPSSEPDSVDSLDGMDTPNEVARPLAAEEDIP